MRAMTVTAPRRPRRTRHSFWTMLLARLEQWAALRRERRRLLELSDAMLKDVGLTRADADREGLRWFWDIPETRR
jgi:uncharacterized protein YjiS (DUF1127 family)